MLDAICETSFLASNVAGDSQVADPYVTHQGRRRNINDKDTVNNAKTMEMNEHQNPAETLFHRNIGGIENPGGRVGIDYVDLGRCSDEDCSNHATGMVGIMVTSCDDTDADDADTARLLMEPGDALILADRLKRAARLALEDGEVMRIAHEKRD